jgi:hypothetical protein
MRWGRLVCALVIERAELGYLEFTTTELMLSALVVAAFSGFMSLMNSIDGDSATEITS